MADCKISDETRARIGGAWPDILERIAAGEEIYRVLQSAGVSLGMARAYMRLAPEARTEWDDAKRDSADAYFDKVVAIANSPGKDAAFARVSMDGFKWLAGKRDPKYNDKYMVDVNVRTIDLTPIILAAQQRAAAAEQARLTRTRAPLVIEGTVTRAVDDLL